MPEGELVTVPPPLTVTVRTSSGWNMALTLWLLLIVTVHTGEAPEHAPDQFEKPNPLEGTSLR
jgi:hypothetical protein